ncbi:MAG: tetratricopeptide repeat protein [Deltaproteobacteria bacterium]|nr:tetratricopeptide repeat protein [Deltaproteobacteria bacterium]
MPAGDVDATPNPAPVNPPPVREDEPTERPIGVGAEKLPSLPSVSVTAAPPTGELASTLPTKAELGREQLEMASQLIARYEREAKAIGKEPNAAPLYLETGRLWEEVLGKQRNAAMCYQRAFQLSSKDPTILHASRRLFIEVGNWQMVGQILRAQIDAETDPVVRARLCSELGLLLELRLKSPKEAEQLYSDALDAWPLEGVALDSLERILVGRKDYGGLLTLVERPIAALVDDDARIRLHGRAAEIAELFLDDVKRATQSYMKILELDSTSAEALESLRRLHASQSQWEALSEVLERQARSGDERRAVELLASAARIQAERMHAPDKAILLFLEAFNLDQTNIGLLREMEALYAENESWDEVANVLRAELNLLEGSRRWPELIRLGRILEERLDDLPGAIAAYEEALAGAPDDPAAPARLERALFGSGRFKELAERMELGLDKLDGKAKTERLYALADLYELRLADPAGAASALSRIVDLDNKDRLALAWLERLERARGQHRAVFELLEKRAAAEDAVEEKLEILTRAAVLAEEQLSDLEKAVGKWTEILALRPTDRRATEELVRVLERKGDFKGLLDAYEALEALVEGADRARLAVRRGYHAEVNVGDADLAAAAYASALLAQPGMRPAIEALARLLRANERWTELFALLEQARDSATSTTERRLAEEEIAKVAEERLDDPASAIAAHESVLNANPRSATARSALSRLYAQNDNGERLAELWADTASREEDKVEKARAACRAAEIFESLGNPERAAELYRSAMDGAVHADAVFSLSTLHWAAGEWDALTALLSRVAESESDPERKAALHVRIALVDLAKRGRVDEAIAELSAALASEPGRLDALDWLAGAQILRGDFEAWLAAIGTRAAAMVEPERIAAFHLRSGAIAALSEAGDPVPEWLQVIEAVPSHPAALAELEVSYRRARSHEGLLALYQRRAELETSAPARASFAFRAAELAETRLSKPDLAATYYEKALRADPNHRAALEGGRRVATVLGNGDLALELLERELALTKDPARVSELAFEAGVIHQDARADLTKALSSFEAVLEKTPAHGGAYERVRGILEQRADFPALIKLLERRAEIVSGPDRAALMLAIATIEEEQILDSATAEARYREVLAVDPENRAALGRLGRLLFDAKRFADARPVLEKSAELYAATTEPTQPDVLELARIYRQLGFIFLEHDRDLVRCVECLQAAIQLDRSDTQSLVRLAEVYEGAGDWTSAINVLLRLADVQRNNPERVKTLVELGRIYAQKLDDLENGILAHRKALELDATNREGILGLVELYEKSGRWADLARDASAYLQAFPPENRAPAIPLHLRLARIYEGKLDDQKRAIEELGRALDVDPTNPDALTELARIHAKSDATLPQALEIHRRLLAVDPFRVDSLHAMRQIFATRKEHDRAFVLSEVLVFLRAATQEEEVFFQEYKDRVPPVGSGELSREEHEQLVTHPDERGVVRYVLEMIAPEVGKVFTGNLGRFDVNARDKQRSELAIRRRADEIAQALGAPPFDLYLTKKPGMDLGIFLECTDPPSLVVGENVPRRMREVESNFLLGRELERMKGAHYLTQSASVAEIELMIFAALKLIRADYQTPKEGPALDEMIRRLARALSRKARKNLDQLSNLNNVKVDLAKHFTAASMTANRAGLVVTNSIETCVRAIAKQNKIKAIFTNPGEAREAIGQHPEIRDILSYSVSDEYLRARARLGFAIELG